MHGLAARRLACADHVATERLDLLANVFLLKESNGPEGDVVRVNGTSTSALGSLDTTPVAGAAAAPARVDAALAALETSLAALAVAATGALGDTHALLRVPGQSAGLEALADAAVADAVHLELGAQLAADATAVVE